MLFMLEMAMIMMATDCELNSLEVEDHHGEEEHHVMVTEEGSVVTEAKDVDLQPDGLNTESLLLVRIMCLFDFPPLIFRLD